MVSILAACCFRELDLKTLNFQNPAPARVAASLAGQPWRTSETRAWWAQIARYLNTLTVKRSNVQIIRYLGTQIHRH